MDPDLGCKVIVLYGPSGCGKSTVAERISRTTGAVWMQVDDLRLALQYSGAQLPENNASLYYFLDETDVWSRPTSELCDAFVGVAEAMIPAVRIVIENHVATDSPMVIEGDGIHPRLIDDPAMATFVLGGQVSFCCIAASGPDELLDNMVTRNRGQDRIDREAAAPHVAANAAFGEWLVEQSRDKGIPVVKSSPPETLMDRVLAAITAGQGRESI